MVEKPRQLADDPNYGGIYWRYPGLARKMEAKDELAALKQMRASGVLHTRFGEREVWFKSDKDLLGATGALVVDHRQQREERQQCRPLSDRRGRARRRQQ
jgi:hypothetical protein